MTPPLLWTDGETVAEPRGFAFCPYPHAFRTAWPGLQDPEARAPALEAALTDHHTDAVRELLTVTGTLADQVALVGFHGHTVLHRPAEHRTWQLGDGQRLANSLRIPVAADFRVADVAAGGEGAPLAPIYHRALAVEAPKPCVFLNLGGVANVTWIGEREETCWPSTPARPTCCWTSGRCATPGTRSIPAELWRGLGKSMRQPWPR